MTVAADETRVAGERFVAGAVRPGSRALLTAILIGAFLASLLTVDSTGGLVHTGGASTLIALLGSLLRPDLDPSFLPRVGRACLLTLTYAVTGLSVAVLLGLPSALVASGVLTRRRTLRLASAGLTRAILAVLRAVDEIVWALLLVAALGLSPLAGVLAIGLPYAATVGRVVAERLQDVADEPLDALRTSGASERQVLLYARLPMSLADLVGYLFYRFECAIRAAAVLSFVGLGGIGFEIDLALDDLRFERVWTLLLALSVIIVGVDAISARIRARLAG